jgi:hypothetical protein
MTITVVTTRDFNGAPSTREVFRGGDRYTIVSGNLEIISSAREALGLYPSGNWLSVYVGDCVTVNPDGSEPVLGGGFGTASNADAVPVVGAGVTGRAAATEPSPEVTGPTPDEDVAEDAEILVRPEPDSHPPQRVGGFGSTPETTRPPGMRPVVFRAKAHKPKERDPDPPPHHRWMRPVVFRAKPYKPNERDPDPPPRNRWMRPVIIRPRTYAPERDDPPTPSPDQ